MNEKDILKILEKFEKEMPKFPDGRINYSHSDKAATVTIFVKHKDKILLLKRSEKVGDYKGKWSVVTGYLDELKPIYEKVLIELKEELGIEKNIILSFHLGKILEIKDENKTFLTCPVSIELREIPEIKLDFEHTEFKWIKKDDLTKFDTIPKLLEAFKNLNL